MALNQEPSQLCALIVSRDWEAAAERARNHPEEIDIHHDPDGWTVFHLVCPHAAPLPVLRELMQIDENPHADDPNARCILKRTRGVGDMRDDDTPLMMACSCGHLSHVQEMVDRAPELVSMRTHLAEDEGMTAGHLAMQWHQRAPLDVALAMAHILLEHDPALRHQITSAGETMTSVLLKHNRKCFDEHARRHPARDGSERDSDLVDFNSFQAALHCCLHGLLEESVATAPLLHRFLQFWEFPLRFLQRALKLRPVLIHEKDERGNTPLHVAASNLCPTEEMVGLGNVCPMAKITFLLEQDPSAVGKRNNDGLLPSQLAVQASGNRPWDDGVCGLLLDACPATVELLGFPDSMCPHALAGAATRNQHSAVFQMLSAKPSLVKTCAMPIGEDNKKRSCNEAFGCGQSNGK